MGGISPGNKGMVCELAILALLTSWPNPEEAFAEVAVGICHVIEESSSPAVPVSGRGWPPVWMVPSARNPFFTGREDVLEELHERFKGGQAQAVSQTQAMSGLGGIGKTQIAVEYAYRHREEYQQVFWASAETAEVLNTLYGCYLGAIRYMKYRKREKHFSAYKFYRAQLDHLLLKVASRSQP